MSVNPTTNNQPLTLGAAIARHVSQPSPALTTKRTTKNTKNNTKNRVNSSAVPPSVIIKVTGNQAHIYQAVEIATLDLPADIFTIAPLMESLLPYWFQDPVNAAAIRQTIFSLTSKRHFKGWRLLRITAPKRVRNGSSIIRIVPTDTITRNGKP